MKKYFTVIFLLTCSVWAENIQVSSLKALETAVKKASPGDEIIIKDGTYQEPFKLTGNGTRERPIVIKAESMGGVIFKKPTSLAGAWITIHGVNYAGDSNITMKGQGLRLSHATFTNSQSKNWVYVLAGSSQTEIDHCLFENKQNNLLHPRGCQLLKVTTLNKKEEHHIHHNHFRNIPKGASGNGFETIQLITRGNPFDPKGGDCGALIENNLFESCNGESEIISIKSNGNRIQKNTFRKCAGELVLRHGHRNQALENIFIGDGEKRSGGIRIQGREQILSGNYFLGLGSSAIALMDGTPDKLYMPVERARIQSNIILDCAAAMKIGMNHSKHPNGTTPKGCIIADNFFIQTETNQSGLIHFVKNDKPIDWTWTRNKYKGNLGIPTNPGLILTKNHPLLKDLAKKAISINQVGPSSE